MAGAKPGARLELADVLHRHGEAYRAAHAGHLGRVERRVMGAILACRTAALGGHVEACDGCGLERVAYNSCRNRHCPKCQGAARAHWLAARQAELLPVPYFHVVFTLPAPIAAVAFQNKALVYAMLFAASAEAMTTLAANPRRLGARIGGLAVLHTWGQTLTHHPHVHCIVPGGGLSSDGTRWVAGRPNFFLAVKPLAQLFRRLRQDGAVKIMRLAPDEFIRRFLLHTLPDGFHRIRYFGFLANTCRTTSLALCRSALGRAMERPETSMADIAVEVAHKAVGLNDFYAVGERSGEFAEIAGIAISSASIAPACPECGGLMRIVATPLRAAGWSRPDPAPFRCDTS